MVSGTGRRVLATPHPSEIHHVSSIQASQRKGKSLQQHRRSRSPSPTPLPSSQRVRMSQEYKRPPNVASSSQRSTQGGEEDQSSQETITEEEKNKLVAEVMRHMLFKNHQQPNVPVRREDLVQLITKTYKQRNLSSAVIFEAQRRMKSMFGLEMKEFVRQRSAKVASASSVDMKEYVLQTILPEAMIKENVLTPTVAPDLGFVLLVVCIVKFSGGEKVKEESLLDKLHGVGVTDRHPVIGDIKDALASAVKQRYIQKEKLTGTDGEGFVYELAERALEPSFKTNLEEFITQVIR